MEFAICHAALVAATLKTFAQQRRFGFNILGWYLRDVVLDERLPCPRARLHLCSALEARAAKTEQLRGKKLQAKLCAACTDLHRAIVRVIAHTNLTAALFLPREFQTLGCAPGSELAGVSPAA
jgi:hypothetical protein